MYYKFIFFTIYIYIYIYTHTHTYIIFRSSHPAERPVEYLWMTASVYFTLYIMFSKGSTRNLLLFGCAFWLLGYNFEQGKHGCLKFPRNMYQSVGFFVRKLKTHSIGEKVFVQKKWKRVSFLFGVPR